MGCNKSFILVFLCMWLVVSNCMEINKGRIIVRQEEEETATDPEPAPAPAPVPEEEGEPDFSNNTNILGYKFRDQAEIDIFRMKFSAFLSGADSDYYAPNTTVCFNNFMNLIEYDFDLLMIKWMYGNAKENTLNTTLFFQNVSQTTYFCIDAGENLYVYSMYKYDLFGRDNTNVLLGGLQNMLGSILTINKVYQQIMEYSELNQTEEMNFAFGRIFRMLVDIEPVMIESAGTQGITLKGQNEQADVGVWGPSPRVKQENTDEEEEVTEEEEQKPSIYDTYDLDEELANFNLAEFDWTFGLLAEIPGLEFLLSLEGPFEFFSGFLNGTQILKTGETHTCERLIQEDFIHNANQIVNMTGVIIGTKDTFENIYNLFDNALLMAKITQQLHPIAFHCWNAGEDVYAHFYDIIAMQNGYDPKNYIMNTVYNFGHIFDNMRDMVFFFQQNPRGQVNSIHDAGYNLGMAVFYLITPEIAQYESEANLSDVEDQYSINDLFD